MAATKSKKNGMNNSSRGSSRKAKTVPRASAKKTKTRRTGKAAEKAALERAALRERAAMVVAHEISFIDNPDFRVMETRRVREPEMPVGITGDLPRHIARDLPAHLMRYCEVPLLTAAQEQVLFRWMNYYKYRANAMRSSLNPARPSVRKLERIAEWMQRSNEIRNHVVRANTRLVISIVKKLANEMSPFDELLSEGTNCLINVVDKFDFQRGFRFSTYATRSVQRELWRLMQRNHRDRQRYCTGVIETFDAELDEEPNEEQISEKTWKRLTRKLNRILEILDDRERFIIRSRYGIIGDKPRTFQSLGDELGVCKERVRQLEIKALKKLYAAAKQNGLGTFELTMPRLG